MSENPCCTDGPGTRLQRLLMPPRCILCGVPGQADPLLDLCAACEQDLPAIGQSCENCAAPIQGAVRFCAACLGMPPAFDGVCCPYRYRWPIDRMLLGFKFGGRLAYGRVLGTLLAKQLANACEPRDWPQAVVPVPLHWRRQLRRGFNQACELARCVSRLHGLPLLSGLCRRAVRTPAQSSLPAKRRRQNLRGAFEVSSRPPRSVLLVDDVMTTGSTCGELAAQLKAAGCEMVIVACVARA